MSDFQIIVMTGLSSKPLSNIKYYRYIVVQIFTIFKPLLFLKFYIPIYFFIYRYFNLI